KRIAPKGAYADGEELAAVARVLRQLRALHAYLKGRQAKYPALWRIGGEIVVLKELEEHVERTVDEVGRVKDDASPELARIPRQLADREGRLRETLMRALRAAIADGWGTRGQPPTRRGRHGRP